MITLEDGSLYGGRLSVRLSHENDVNVSATFVLLINHTLMRSFTMYIANTNMSAPPDDSRGNQGSPTY
jgi:hypothetical protein